MENQFIITLASQLASQLPGLIVSSLGMIFSLYFRQRNPTKFLLTAISFSMFFVIDLAYPIFFAWTTYQYAENGLPVSQMGSSIAAFRLLITPVYLLSWGVLFIAIFNQKYNSIEKDVSG